LWTRIVLFETVSLFRTEARTPEVVQKHTLLHPCFGYRRENVLNISIKPTEFRFSFHMEADRHPAEGSGLLMPSLNSGSPSTWKRTDTRQRVLGY